MVLMDGGGGLVQRKTIHTAQDFLPAAASPVPSIYQSRIRLETSVCRAIIAQQHRCLICAGEKVENKQGIYSFLKCDVTAQLHLRVFEF